MKHQAAALLILGLFCSAGFAETPSPEQSKNESGVVFAESSNKDGVTVPVYAGQGSSKSPGALINARSGEASADGALAVPEPATSQEPAQESHGWRVARRVAETGGAIVGGALGWVGYLSANFETGGTFLGGVAVIGVCTATGFAVGRYGTDAAEYLFASGKK